MDIVRDARNDDGALRFRYSMSTAGRLRIRGVSLQQRTRAPGGAIARSPNAVDDQRGIRNLFESRVPRSRGDR